MTTLFTTDQKSKYTGSRELVPLTEVICLWCGPVDTFTYSQPALFYHGGYGATESCTVRSCHCGAVRSISLASINPRRLG